MNILFVNQKCGFYGGVEQNMGDSAQALRSRGHRCVLAYGETTSRNAPLYQGQFDECIPCQGLGPPTTARKRASLGSILRQCQSEVVYFHKTEDLFLDQIPSDTRTVRMVHDHDICCPRRHKYFALSGKVCHCKAGWRCWADGAFLTRSPSSPLGVRFVSIRQQLKRMEQNKDVDLLLAGSRYMRSQLLQNGFRPDKVHILPPVTRLSCPKQTPVPKEPKILYVGQLIRGKGVDLLLRALHRMSCDFSAAIVGTGNDEARLKALCRSLDLDKRVEFKGWVPHHRLSRFYVESTVLALPSRWPEPFGMVGLEAMIHGRPVVGFKVGGIADWLQDGISGFAIPEQDIVAFAAALEGLLLDTKLANRLGQRAHRYVLKHFAFDRYIDQLESFLRATTVSPVLRGGSGT